MWSNIVKLGGRIGTINTFTTHSHHINTIVNNIKSNSKLFFVNSNNRNSNSNNCNNNSNSKLKLQQQQLEEEEMFSNYFADWKWVKTSKQQLEDAEKRMLESIKVPYEQTMVKVGDHEINTIVAGEGEPLVLIHGYGAGLPFWSANIGFLSQHYKVYAIDLVGFGRSSRVDLTKTIKTPQEAESFWVDSIHAWTDQVGLDSFHLLGHSLGGFLSAGYSLKYPEKVKKLVLADSWGIPHRPDNYEENLPTTIKYLGKIITPDVPLALLRFAGPMGPDLIYRFRKDLLYKFKDIYPNDLLEQVKQQQQQQQSNQANQQQQQPQQQTNRVAEYIYHSNAQSPATGEFLFKNLSLPLGWSSYPLIDRIKEMSPEIQVTLLYGSNSWIDRTPGYKLKEEMKNIKDIIVIENSGHHIYIDNVDQFNNSILKAIPVRKKDTLFN